MTRSDVSTWMFCLTLVMVSEHRSGYDGSQLTADTLPSAGRRKMLTTSSRGAVVWVVVARRGGVDVSARKSSTNDIFVGRKSEPGPCQHRAWASSKASIETVVRREMLVRWTEIATRKERRSTLDEMKKNYDGHLPSPRLHHKDACR